MSNLLKETMLEIQMAGKTVADVKWVGSHDGEYAISWDDFQKIADVEYDSGYGAAEVATDLVLVFSDNTWLERGEYDGSEWWNYNSPPTKSPKSKPFDRAVGELWPSIKDLNKKGRERRSAI